LQVSWLYNLALVRLGLALLVHNIISFCYKMLAKIEVVFSILSL
jgi:hypothetical protein